MIPTTGSRLGAVALAGGLFLAKTARAQTTDPQLAQSLFEQARGLVAAGRYKEACPLFAESQRLDPGGGTLLNLGLCHEQEGKTATAWTELNAALSVAIKDGRKGRENIARQHIAALEPKLLRLTVTVPSKSEVAGISVSLDGIPLARPTWGIAAAVDPGTHKVEAAAPGRRGWSALIVMATAGETRVVDVPPLEPDAAAAVACPEGFVWSGATCVRQGAPVPAPAPTPAPPLPTLAPSAEPEPAPVPTTPVDVGQSKTSGGTIVRYTIGGLSLGALGTSLATGIVAWTDHTYVNDHCNTSRNYCDGQEGIDKQSQSRTWAWVSTITLGVGVVGAGVFVFWPSSIRAPSVTAVPVAGGGALLVSGAL